MLGLSEIEWLGIAAACLTTLCFLPQMVKGMKPGALDSVSLSTYLMLAAGKVSWLAYGIMIESLPLCISNTTSFTLITVILIMKVRPRAAKA